MLHIGRALTIARVSLRYRLDTFATALDRSAAPWPLRLLLGLLDRLPEPSEPRGLRLRRCFEDLGPVFIKFGQLLSTRPDLIPADLCAELDLLQDKVPPFDGAQFIERVEKALGAPIGQLFSDFDVNALASASIAQVHAARLLDGREVVVKAARPGIAAIIDKDCALLLILARWVEKYSADGKRLHPVEVAQDYRSTIVDELDLQREAANTAILRRNFEDSELLHVPAIHWPYTNKNVLVMERIYATPVTDLAALREANIDFKVLAERGLEIFFTQVFSHNFFHADMHPGNIFVDTHKPRQPSYLAIDCAIIGSLSPEEQYFLARILLATFRRDYRQVAEMHQLAGWVKPDAPLGEVEAAVRTVCEPIFQRPLKDISCGHLLVNLFQIARRFDAEVQPSLVLLQKTLLNVEGLGRQLYPDLDLWSTAQPFLERWLVERYKPQRLLQQLQRHGPDWLEQIPQVPQLLMDGMDQLKHLDRSLQSRAESPATLRPSRLPAAVLIGLGLGLLSKDGLLPSQNNLAELAMIGIGVLLLALR